MSNTVKNLVVILGLVSVGIALYFMFMQGADSPLNFDVNSADVERMRQNSNQFIQRKRQLNEVKLDLSTLNDPALTGLQSFDSPIVEQPVGRENPFLETTGN
jgi:UDP-N-acetyl-D-mannosaminuronate dehydrogenase